MTFRTKSNQYKHLQVSVLKALVLSSPQSRHPEYHFAEEDSGLPCSVPHSQESSRGILVSRKSISNYHASVWFGTIGREPPQYWGGSGPVRSMPYSVSITCSLYLGYKRHRPCPKELIWVKVRHVHVHLSWASNNVAGGRQRQERWAAPSSLYATESWPLVHRVGSWMCLTGWVLGKWLLSV